MKKSRINHALAVLLMAGFMFSCSESNIITDNSTEQLPTTNVNALAAKQAQKDPPQKVFIEFMEMVNKVQKMDLSKLETLGEDEVLELGEPIFKAIDGTIKLSESTLQTLRGPLTELQDNFRSLTKDEHNVLSEEIEQIVASDKKQERNFTVEDIKELFLTFNRGEAALMSTCDDFFNVYGSTVSLIVGDNFNLANSICTTYSYFVIAPGTHNSQSVVNSNDGNNWIGTGSAIMDGQNSIDEAFKNGMKNNSISEFTIKNYKEHGIYSNSGSSNLEISNMIFNNIAPSDTGRYKGAVVFYFAEDVEVRNSYFEDVASGILFTQSDGPLKVINNEALNSGRNFFQCDECEGGNIRINGNSLDRTSSYGIAVLEDWINIHKSKGENTDWIQVNNNRARGHSNSDSGSFIILGDGGGEYQEAIGNIGVSPGQVGIGAAGGKYLKVKENIMYSEPWTHASQGFYSANYSGLHDSTCDNHEFPGPVNFTPNTASWNNNSIDRAWASGECGIDIGAIRDSVVYDPNINENIWYDW